MVLNKDMTTTYTVRDEHERYVWDCTTRRNAESAARKYTQRFLVCTVVIEGESIVTIVNQTNGRTEVTRLR